ncbi:hypothetical protein SR1949_41820 [Sphaerospermopsis reniformis]|uniref:CopG-like ribbon-helix-helix domain-containing protein n=1 Tax=Sphaerospermopsis reniformis TaxID=531300 RepID=A0A480A789_9CYAN|nr:hypothetical protein [Sphaerospermopsis reniformis]GCL39061.1 hypothetical protein SR1949_41820 [Sphaerospermopsis reniformis]
MTSLDNINLPDELYQQIVKLAKAEHNSIESQIVLLLQTALEIEQQQIESGRCTKILKLLEETQNIRRSNPADFKLRDSTEMIREDRDR